jgi:hypothetical protein
VIVRLVLWSLADSDATIEQLRASLNDESFEEPSTVPGLLFAAWLSDESTERWGAIHVWASREASEQALPSRARELIGKEPEIFELFDVEATVSVAGELAHHGLAFET